MFGCGCYFVVECYGGSCYASYPFGILCLSAIRIMFVKSLLAVDGYCGLNESGLCVFRKLCPVGFLVVCECSSVLLQYVVMSYIDCGDDEYVVR